MSTMTIAEIIAAIEAKQSLAFKDLRGADLRDADLRGAVLRGAVLTGADLRDADLRDADLRDADLRGADLRGAVLRGAVLTGADLTGAVMVDGVSWERYLSETVPALCTAGGVPLEVVAEAWECHSWENCPMAVAFGVHSPADVPPLYREQAESFVRLFDAHLIPKPTLPSAASIATEAAS